MSLTVWHDGDCPLCQREIALMRRLNRHDGERVEPQPGSFYGGWITSKVAGPIKGILGSDGW